LMHIRRLIWVSVLALSIVITFGLLWLTSLRSSSAKSGTEDTVPVVTETAHRQDIPVYLNGLGSVQALNTVTVRAQIDGKIIKVNFQEGQDVRAGDLLMQIDPRPYQAALDQSLAKQNQDQAQLDYAQKVLSRDVELFDKRVLDPQSLDLQKATATQMAALVKADEAAVASAKVQLEFTKITSPIDGRVGLRLVDQGNIVHASDLTGLVIITQIRPISVIFTLPESNLREVTKRVAANDGDQSLTVVATDQENNQILDQGELGAMDNQIDQATGTIKLKAIFKNRQLGLWPGQFVNIRLLVDTRKQALVVPANAVSEGPNGDFVYVIRPDLTAQVKTIKTGTSEAGFTIIENGVSERDEVVVDGQYLLKPNAHVRLKQAQ
ncbi:MAG TPA: efflux RND transporter periplasmic adaptor subunit, partial [Anaerolineales bacterium]|nr:efflux RND transporter periplasmic adaptor subunit [Anaerolineales bacterium]